MTDVNDCCCSHLIQFGLVLNWFQLAQLESACSLVGIHSELVLCRSGTGWIGNSELDLNLFAST